MKKKRELAENDFLLEHNFSNLTRFCVLRKEIVWQWAIEPGKIEDGGTEKEVSDPSEMKRSDITPVEKLRLNIEAERFKHGDLSAEVYFSKDNIIIKSFAGFTDPGSFRKYINSLWNNEINALRKTLSNVSTDDGINLLEQLIGQSEDLENWVLKNVEPGCKIFCNADPIPEPDAFTEKIICRNTESFINAFLRSIGELVYRLFSLKGDLEHPKDAILTFEYIGSREDLENLLDALRDKLFVDKTFNSAKEFVAVFSGKPLIKQIMWSGNVYELVQFINILKKRELLRNKGISAKKIVHCFINKSNCLYSIKELHKSSSSGRITELQNIINSQLKGKPAGKSKK